MLKYPFIFLRQVAFLLVSIVVANTVHAEWAAGIDFSTYYTDDVGLFSVTRRLSLEEDPTQPIVDEPDQGSDFVYDPNVYIRWSTENKLGEFQLLLDAGGYIFNDHSDYSHGFFQITAEQAFNEKTRIKFLYDFIPRLFIGENTLPQMHHKTGEEHELQADERLDNHILALHLEYDLTDTLALRGLLRYGLRDYDQPFSYRDTQFFTIGSHLEWEITPDIELLVGYHFERGYTDESETVHYQDDIGYINHFTSAELKIRVIHDLFLIAIFDYEHNDFTSPYESDRHYQGNENVYQGELELLYELNEMTVFKAGWQQGKRRFNYEDHNVYNNNVWLGAEFHF